ncbi:hypothetical protein Z3_241 [Bacillus phage Z3]|nr:hypothetical protein Z3_241 [Bacillus phage Z3]
MVHIFLGSSGKVVIKGNDVSGNFFCESMSYEEFMENVKSIQEAREKQMKEELR